VENYEEFWDRWFATQQIEMVSAGSYKHSFLSYILFILKKYYKKLETL